MRSDRSGQIVVIFLSIRTGADDAGYGEAAAAMESLAATQPGYRGFESTRGADGLGITLSFWADEASALLWRNHPEHKAIRDAGRDRWYQRYEVIVCEAQRSYAWARQ
jgi:heme-degrading monooxygenase HmoA